MKFIQLYLLIAIMILSCKNDNAELNINKYGFIINSSTNISELNLSGLEIIEGDVSISSTTLTDLTFLKEIKCIEGILKISHNTNMETLEGLNKLECVNELHIRHNNNLRNISSIANLRIKKTLVIYENDIEEIGVLKNLEKIEGDIGISEQFLSNLILLENLIEIGGELIIVNNLEIENFDDLSNLEKLGTKIHIKGNLKLEDFCSLKVSLEKNPEIESQIEFNKENPSIEDILMSCQ